MNIIIKTSAKATSNVAKIIKIFLENEELAKMIKTEHEKNMIEAFRTTMLRSMNLQLKQ